MRRLFGDSLLEGVLFLLTLGVGWLIWFSFEARKGQTPAKRLVGVKIHDYRTGAVASARRVWVREVVGKIVASAVIGVVAVLITGSEEAGVVSRVYDLFGALLVLTTVDRRTTWDYLSGTTVRLHT